MVKLRNGWFIYSTYILVVSTENLTPKEKKQKQNIYSNIKKVKESSEYMISDYYRILDLSEHVQLVSVSSAHPTHLDSGWHQGTERGRRSALC